MAQGTWSTGKHVEHEDCRYGTRASTARNLAHSKIIRLPLANKFLLFLFANYHNYFRKEFCELYNLKILMKRPYV